MYRRRLFEQKQLEGCNGKEKGMLMERCVEGTEWEGWGEAQSWKALTAVPGTRTDSMLSKSKSLEASDWGVGRSRRQLSW